MPTRTQVLGATWAHTRICTEPSFHFLFMIKSCPRHVRKPRYPDKHVVCLYGDYHEHYTARKPDAPGGRPSILIFNKLTWWFHAHIPGRTCPEFCLCPTDTNKETWGGQLSYCPARQGLGSHTSRLKAGFASKAENYLYLVFIGCGSKYSPS